MSHGQGWIGVDLDGTLAMYSGWCGADVIGAPVPLMVARVKRWLAEGKDVRIMTARVDGAKETPAGIPPPVEVITAAIQAWCLKHVGQSLPVTNRKDMHMIELWDDRACYIQPNTGRPGVHPSAHACFECGEPVTVICTACNQPA